MTFGTGRRGLRLRAPTITSSARTPCGPSATPQPAQPALSPPPPPPVLLPVPLAVELLVLPPVVPGWPPVVGVASVLPLLVLLLVLLVLSLLVPLLVLVVLPVVVLVLVVLPLVVLPLLVLPLSELPLLVPLLVLPVSLPPDDVSPAGRHRSMVWQVSPTPPQVSLGEQAPPCTGDGSGKQLTIPMHAFAGWQVVPSGHSSSLVQASAKQCAPQWPAPPSLPGGQSSGGRGMTSARAEPANSANAAARGQTRRKGRYGSKGLPRRHGIIRRLRWTAATSPRCCAWPVPARSCPAGTVAHAERARSQVAAVRVGPAIAGASPTICFGDQPRGTMRPDGVVVLADSLDAAATARLAHPWMHVADGLHQFPDDRRRRAAGRCCHMIPPSTLTPNVAVLTPGEVNVEPQNGISCRHGAWRSIWLSWTPSWPRKAVPRQIIPV